MTIRLKRLHTALALAIVATLTLALGGCGGGNTISCRTKACTVTVSWTANRETAVNSPGGGYDLYYSTTPGFNISSVTPVNIPYAASTSSTPTSATLNLFSGTYYFKIVAYSALNPPGGSSGSTSTPSAQQSLTLP